MNFLAHTKYPFDRKNNYGHIVVSGIILSSDKKKVILIEHKKLNKWLQPGGHAEVDDFYLVNAATRECEEETGFNVKPIFNDIFDIDAHLIPEHNDEIAHWHFDVRFLFEIEHIGPVTEKFETNVNKEIDDIAWVNINKLHEWNDSPSITRIQQKLQDRLNINTDLILAIKSLITKYEKEKTKVQFNASKQNEYNSFIGRIKGYEEVIKLIKNKIELKEIIKEEIKNKNM